MDAAGNLFGAASAGGSGMASFCGDTGCGTVFELQPPSVGGGHWTAIDIHDFLVNFGDGIAPDSIVLGPGGVLYGTTCCGGAGGGTVFKLIPPASGGSWTEKILYSFTGNQGTGDGYLPNGVTQDKNGGLFGTTQQGGVSSTGFGTVFHLTPAYLGKGWTESVLYAFTGGSDGAAPKGGVLVMISWLAPMALVRKETSGWRRAFFTALRRLPALPRTAARYSASFRSDTTRAQR